MVANNNEHKQVVKRGPIIGHQVICSAFIQKGNKVLSIFDPGFKVWRVPGGRAEWGERLEDTLIREMKEETGLKFIGPKFIGFGQGEQYHHKCGFNTSRLILFFHVKTDKEPRLDPHEASDFKWVTLEELKAKKDKETTLNDFFQRNPDFALD